MNNNNENQPSYDMWQQLLQDNYQAPAMSSTNQSHTSQASGSANPPPLMGPPASFCVNPYSQPFYNTMNYNPIMGHNWSEQQRVALTQAQLAFQFQQQQQQQQPPPPPEADSVASADDEDETQDQTGGRGGKRKKPQKPVDKRLWNDEETDLLARCWVHYSQDPVIGRNQTDAMFWNKIVEMFNNKTKNGIRSRGQIQGKWSKIKKGVKEFGATFKRVSEQGRQSGADERLVYDAAISLYKKTTGEKSWHYQKCYDLLKDVITFCNDNASSSRQPDPAVDLTVDDTPRSTPVADETPVPSFQQLFADDPIRRPPGRNVSRRLSSSSDATSNRSSGSEAAKTLTDYLWMQQEALEQAQVRDAMKFLAKPIPTGLSRKDLKAHMAYRKHLQEKFGSMFYADAEDDDDSDD